jgi:hypothetical protein
VGARFSAPVHTGLGAHPASYTMGTLSFQGAKSGRARERVELYLYSLYGPYGLFRASVPVQRCTVPYGLCRASVPVQRCTLPYGLYRASVPVQRCTLPFGLTEAQCLYMGALYRTACTEPQRLYNGALYRTACTEPQCLYNGALYLTFIFTITTLASVIPLSLSLSHTHTPNLVFLPTNSVTLQV